jgi:hypothetical protein
VALTPEQRGYRCVYQVVDQEGEDAGAAYKACTSEAGRQFGFGSAEYGRVTNGMTLALQCLVAQGLSGCPSELPAPTNSQNPSDTTLPPPSTAAPQDGTQVGGQDKPNPLAQGSRFDGFKTPSGNIVCWVFEVTDSSEPAQLECAVLSLAKTWVLPQTEQVTLFDEIKTDRMARVLGYGRRWRDNSLQCYSQVRGLTCRDTQTGHGFFLSRAKQRIF